MKQALVLICAVAALVAVPTEHGLAGSESDPGDAVSEVRIGVLLHDQAFLHERKETGQDLNLEVLFPSPRWKLFQAVRSPRPHLGASINNNGGTNQLYGGFTWEWRPAGNAFVNGSLGLSLHDGALEPGRRGLEGLGLRVLFRESVEVGYRFRARHGLSFLIDHISNAGLASENQGITSMGIRYAYRF